jgi:hypothetical protein
MDMTARTKQEMLEVFTGQVEVITRYWAGLDISDKEKCEGVAFSIMNIFDGTCGGFPCAVDLVLRPHPDDKQYYIDNNEPYIDDGMTINDEVQLHELLVRK